MYAPIEHDSGSVALAAFCLLMVSVCFSYANGTVCIKMKGILVNIIKRKLIFSLLIIPVLILVNKNKITTDETNHNFNNKHIEEAKITSDGEYVDLEEELFVVNKNAEKLLESSKHSKERAAILITSLEELDENN